MFYISIACRCLITAASAHIDIVLCLNISEINGDINAAAGIYPNKSLFQEPWAHLYQGNPQVAVAVILDLAQVRHTNNI